MKIYTYTIEMRFKNPPTLTLTVQACSITQAKTLGIEEAKRAGSGTPVRILVKRIA